MRAKLLQAVLEWQRVLRRAGRDRRAQKLLLAAVALLVLLAVEAVNILRNPWALLLFALGVGGTLLIRRVHRRRNSTAFTLRDHAPAEPERTPPAEAVSQLARQALVLACLLERVHGELYLRSHTIGENDEIILRRRVLAVAQRHALLEAMTPERRDLLLCPDGAWDDDAIAGTLVLQESLRVLLWALEITPLLSPIEDVYQFDSRISGEAFAKENELPAATAMRPLHKLRQAARVALGYYTRCLAEQQRRGGAELGGAGLDAEMGAELEAIAAEMQGESVDLLIGAVTVGASSTSELRLASAQSWRRWQTLEGLISFRETGDRVRLDDLLGAPPPQS